MDTEVLPIELVNIPDDGDGDDDLSVIYASPISRKRGTNSNDAISVEEYAEDRDLQLAIMASLFPETPGTWRGRTKRVIDLSKDYNPVGIYEDDDVKIVYPTATPLRKNTKRFRGISIREPGESSNSQPDADGDTAKILAFVCEICVEPKPYRESFSILGCPHNYCSECVVKYVASKLQNNITQIPCPVSRCKGLLEPEHCRPILPPEVFDRWGNALCEAVILASAKFYCPFKDCSAMLIDESGLSDGTGVITQSECPNCCRLFCAQCKVPWHLGIECAEFQKLNKDEREKEDIMLMQLAKNKKWMRCPKCKFYVERSEGCPFMRCRCGFDFCYSCGSPIQGQRHYCSNCRR